jgi:hypothetical protein
MKSEFSNYEITGQKPGPKPAGNVNVPGSMTQEQINARNDAVIAHQAEFNKNPQQRNVYQQVNARTQSPARTTFTNEGQVQLTPYEAFAHSFVEPIRDSWGYLTGQGYSRPDDPYEDPVNSRWLDTVNRFNNSIAPDNPIPVNYKDTMLDAANASLLLSANSALGAGAAVAAPAVGAVAGGALRAVPYASRVAPLASNAANYGRQAANAVTAAFPRAAPVVNSVAQRAIPLGRSAKDFYADVALPFYSYSRAPTTNLGVNLFRAGMGAGAGYQALDSYQQGMREYGITQNPAHSIRAGLYNQFVNTPFTPGPVPLLTGLAGSYVGEAAGKATGEAELRRRSYRFADTPEGAVNAKDPLVYRLGAQDPRQRQAALEAIEQMNPYATTAANIFGTLADFKRPLGLPSGQTSERDGELIRSNVELMETGSKGLADPETAINTISNFSDSIKNNLIARGYAPEAITPQVVIRSVDDAAAAYTNNAILQFRNSHPDLVTDALARYNNFKKHLYSSNGNDYAISIAYYQLMQDLNAIRNKIAPPLPGE